MACRRIIPPSAGGIEIKRRLKKYVTGKARPVNPLIKRKKNNQRGPRIGSVVETRIANPPHPKSTNNMEAHKKVRKEGKRTAEEVWFIMKIIS
jgi:hypothetical protein